jgi:putative spermidine/putrescine transport system ATP-binding protein
MILRRPVRPERAEIPRPERNDRAVLELRNVVKRYGGHPAVDDVSLSIGRAELVTLLGPSGSGKTTILNMTAGFQTPDRGQILLNGEDVARMPASERGIGVVFQSYALFPHLTVRDNVAYGLKRRRWKDPAISSRVEEMLELVGLAHAAKRRPAALSGGQQQRVALARALAFRPNVLLMDEPLGALDRETGIQMREEIRRIHREVSSSILYVTHNKEEAFALSDKVGVMRDGKLIGFGAPSDLYEQPSNVFIARFFGNWQLLAVKLISAAGTGDAEAVEFCGRRATVASALARGTSGSAIMAIEPGAISIAPADPRALRITTKVIDTVPMGPTTHVRCALEDGQVVLFEVSRSDQDRAVTGSTIDLGIDLGRCRLLSDQ